MNLFELQERLKDFSQEQLVREMQAPTGSAPQYLVLSELQRRQRMMAEEQAQMQQPQTTVAEDAIAAAGMPQGGLADMARSMAPQTDMDMNTAAQPVERMADGGEVRGPMTAEERFQVELRTRLREARDEYDPLMEALSDVPMYRDYETDSDMDLETTGFANIGTALRRGVRCLGGEEPVGEMMGRSDELRRYIRELERRRDSLPPGPGSLTSPRDSGDVPRMADGGVVRMQPGGLAGISRDIRDFAPRLPAEIAGVRREDFMLLSPEEQADIIQFEDPTAEMRARGAEVFPEYDPQRTGQGFLIETLTPGRAAEVRASAAAARDAEAAAETEAVDDEELNPPELAIDQDEDEGTPRLSFGDQFGDVDPALARRGGDEELTFGDIEPTGALIPFALPVGADEDTDADVEAVVNGGGGAAAPAMDDAFEQDKWLALAQAGLSLMSSQQPTIGGAIGEAGLAGITALRQARGERDERISAQQARADRLAAAAARGERDTITGTERAAYFRAANEASAEADALELALARGGVADDLGMVTPYTEEELAILRRQLNDAKSRANIYSGISNPSLANIQATLE